MKDRELDVAIGKEVMGWTLGKDDIGNKVWYDASGGYARGGALMCSFAVEFRPSRRISDAWEIVDRMWPRSPWALTRVQIGDHEYAWTAGPVGVPVFRPLANTPELAICFAALHAKGIDVEVTS